MKYKLILGLFLLTAMISMPLLVMDKQPVVQEANGKENKGYISVFLTDNGKIENVDEKEYIKGTLAAETDMTFCDEALKAQAVACNTYGFYIKKNGNGKGLNGADISDSSSVHQGYLNENERRKKWGDNFDEYESKAEEIAESVAGQLITFNGEPIKALYFDCSNGVTQSAETVFSEKVEYLSQVQSAGDKLSVRYTNAYVLTSDELKSDFEKIHFSGEPEKWIGNCDKTENGYVNSVEICGETVSGKEFREKTGISSCIFYISYENGKFSIISYGNGHLVGMSQFGANYMAKQGADYKEILKHYYTGVEIST